MFENRIREQFMAAVKTWPPLICTRLLENFRRPFQADLVSYRLKENRRCGGFSASQGRFTAVARVATGKFPRLDLKSRPRNLP